MSEPGDEAIAQSAEAIVKSSRPDDEHAPPADEVGEPAGGDRNAANTMLYALRTHDSDAIDASGNERAMSGNAMLTIVASTNAMNDAQRRDRQHRPRLRSATAWGGWGRRSDLRRLGMRDGHRAVPSVFDRVPRGKSGGGGPVHLPRRSRGYRLARPPADAIHAHPLLLGGLVRAMEPHQWLV